MLQPVIENALVAQPGLALAKPESVLVRVARFLVPEAWRTVFATVRAYDSELGKHVGTGYSPGVVEDLQDDEAVAAARSRMSDAVTAIAPQMAWLNKVPLRTRMLLPGPLRKDRVMRERAERMITIFAEVSSFASSNKIVAEADEWAAIPGLAPTTPRYERRSATPWFVGDPGVPVEIAELFMAAYTARTTADLARAAARRRAWSRGDLARAMTDSFEKYERALVFIASLPGASIPSLADHPKLDLEALVARQNERRRQLGDMATRQRVETGR